MAAKEIRYQEYRVIQKESLRRPVAAAFTPDILGHANTQMKKRGADPTEQKIWAVSDL